MADDHQHILYSQFGEDAVLQWIFHGKRNGFYVDVGCHHPFRFSNTAVLHHQAGWTGINIDVDQRAVDEFNKSRPEDINILKGIAGKAGKMEVTIFSDGAINTFDPVSAAHPAWANIAREKRIVDVEPLSDVLRTYLPPSQTIDLLTIDAEGIDLEVLKSNDWTLFSPEVVMVEASNFDVSSPSGNPTFEFLSLNGYKLISHVAITSVFRKTSEVDKSLSSEQVKWLYRCFLNREPESAATIDRIRRETKDFRQARENLMSTEEFTMNLPKTPQVFFIPERFPVKSIKSSKTLALATIVKDEARYIENMLRSCASLVDYVVVVDTGSNDKTLEICRSCLSALDLEYVIKEVQFNTFSQARNSALELVPPAIDWILMLDADEEILAEDYWRFAALLESDVDGWQLPRFNFSDAGRRRPPVSYPDYQRRLFRNSVERPVRYAGAVHEVPENVDRWGHAPASTADGSVVGGPHIHHLGYMDITQSQWQKKHDFYSALATKA